MAISFKEIPANLRVPGAYHEISNRLAGSSQSSKVALIFAALSSTQQAKNKTTLYKPLRIISESEAKKHLGDGEGFSLVKDFLAVNNTLELYALPLPEGYNGTSAVDFTAKVWPELTDFDCNWFVYAGSTPAQIAAIETELDSRYKATRQIGARCFYAVADTATNLLNYTKTRNNPHMVLLPLTNGSTEKNKWLSRFAGAVTRQLAIDPSASLNQIKVAGISSTEQFPFATRNQFLWGGISTWIAAKDGSIYIERVITNYTTTPEGRADSSYLDVQIPETLDAIRRLQNAEIRKRFAGAKLGPDTLSVEPGQNVVTPSLMKSFLLSLYRNVFIGQKLWCVNPDAYKASLKVELSKDDKNTLCYYDQPELIGRFDVAKGLSEFK